MNSENKAKKLCASGLQFDGVVKVVQKYWELEPSLLSMTFYKISHEQIGKCKNWISKYVIYASLYKIEDHQCQTTGYNKRVLGKVYIYVILQFANCGGDYSANLNQCTLRYKIKKKA